MRSLKVTIWKRKTRWIGDIKLSDGMLETVKEGRAEGKNGRGSKRFMMLDDVQEGYDYHIVKQMALDRGRGELLC